MPDYDPEDAAKVLGFRRAGVQFDAIAQRLAMTVEDARGCYAQAVANYDPTTSRMLEADRLDRLHMAVWPKAAEGDLDAVDRVLKISEARRKVLADPVPNDHALRQAYDAAVATSEHITGIDEAIVMAGRTIADRVDEAVAHGEGQEVTKALYLLPHLTHVLRELLATPAARQAAGLVAPKPKAGQLAQLRAVHKR